MPDVSWGELLVIGIVALVVIGPKDLPRVMRTVGTWMRKLRGMAAEFQGAVNEMVRQEEIEEIRKQIAQLRDPELEAQLERTMAQAQERVRPPAPVDTETWAAAPTRMDAADEEFLSEDLDDITFEPPEKVTAGGAESRPAPNAGEPAAERERAAPAPAAQADPAHDADIEAAADLEAMESEPRPVAARSGARSGGAA